MADKNMDPQDITAAEMAQLDEAAGIAGEAEAEDLDSVTAQYDPSSEVLEDDAADATA